MIRNFIRLGEIGVGEKEKERRKGGKEGIERGVCVR